MEKKKSDCVPVDFSVKLCTRPAYKIDELFN